MKIALVGYGKMGQMIHRAAEERGHQITACIDPVAAEATAKSISAGGQGLQEAEVVIEFSHPEAVMGNLQELIALGKSTVVGTTGWHHQLANLSPAIQAAGIGFLWSSNFSLGVNLFYKILQGAAQLLDPYAQYDVAAFESHHRHKADSPSGTAKAIAERILASMTRKTEVVWETLRDRPPKDSELHFPSLRLGAVPGTHSVFFDSSADTIELTHTARNREGFASGSVVAAEWLCGKKGIYTMDDVLAGL